MSTSKPPLGPLPSTPVSIGSLVEEPPCCVVGRYLTMRLGDIEVGDRISEHCVIVARKRLRNRRGTRRVRLEYREMVDVPPGVLVAPCQGSGRITGDVKGLWHIYVEARGGTNVSMHDDENEQGELPRDAHPCYVDWCPDIHTDLYETRPDGSEVWYCGTHWPHEEERA